jgi:hypothetical protein
MNHPVIFKRISKSFFFLVLFCVLAAYVFVAPETDQVEQQRRHLVALKPDLTATFSVSSSSSMRYISPYPTELIHNINIRVKNEGKVKAEDFFVDVFLSVNNQYSFAPNARRPPLLIDGRKHVQDPINPGQTKIVNAYVKTKIPDSTQPGDYYLGVAVDSTNKINESNENNNTHFYRVSVKARITHAQQTCEPDLVLGSIRINGAGFGSSQGTRVVRVDNHELSVSQWSKNQIWVPLNIPQSAFGNNYEVYLFDKATNKVYSNKVNVTPQRILGGIIPNSGAAGSNTLIVGCSMGSSQGTKVIRFGNTTAQAYNWSNEDIGIVVPSLPPGQYQVYIEDSGKKVSNERTYTIQ